MNCEICKKKISENRAKKIMGTYIKDENGKLHLICNECQKKYKTKKEMLSALVA